MFATGNLEHHNDYDDADDDGASAWLRCGWEGWRAGQRRLRHHHDTTCGEHYDASTDFELHNNHPGNLEHHRNGDNDYDGANYDYDTDPASVFGAAVWPDTA